MNSRQQINGSLALEQKKVIVIGAAQRPEALKLRVAAYCRVSFDSLDQMNSFMAQLNYYTTLIASKENWTMTDMYADAGISGTSAEKRPEFQRLLSDCRKGLIDIKPRYLIQCQLQHKQKKCKNSGFGAFIASETATFHFSINFSIRERNYAELRLNPLPAI